MVDIMVPEGGFRVSIIDLSGASEDRIVEEVKGFPTLGHANAFARAYVRDSIERCRLPGAAARDVLANWFAFGEDAEVADAGAHGGAGGGWRSASELDDFAAHSGAAVERDWRTLDPRLVDLDDGDDIEEEHADEESGD